MHLERVHLASGARRTMPRVEQQGRLGCAATVGVTRLTSVLSQGLH
jgi:hypothetical protein